MNSILINSNKEKQYELTKSFVRLIRSAKNYIKLGNFIFEHELIITELLKIIDSGVAVFILTNSDENSKRTRQIEVGNTNDTDDAIEYDARSYDKHLINIKLLADHGAHIRCLEELHAKFIVVDGIIGSIMSANITYNSLGKNNESGLYVDNEELKELEFVFDSLFMNADASTIGGSKSKAFKVRRRLIPICDDSFKKLKSRMKFTLCSKETNNIQGCNVQTLYQSIINIINNAEKFCYIVTWHFNELKNLSEFQSSLDNAIKRGVKIYLYSNNHDTTRSQRQNQEILRILKGLGCKIEGDDNNHSKCVISETDGIIFTANIDGNRGLKRGFEVGCMLTNEQRLEYMGFINQLFRNPI